MALFARAFVRAAEGRDAILASPLRGELLGPEHLAERARAAARDGQVAPRRKGRRNAPLLARLDGTQRILQKAHVQLSADADADIGPAGVWLLDNFHVLQEHIREVRESLPRGYYRELPELDSGHFAGYPRIYELALTLIAHTEGRVGLENVELFLHAFQEVAPLTIGELWALPAMLRMGLIENVRRMTLRTVKRLEEVDQADEWARRIQEAGANGAPALNAALRAFATYPPELTAPFVSRFLQQLRMAPGSAPSLVRLEQWIDEEGLSAEEAAARSNQRLAHTQLMMANSITSLRGISHQDWRSCVERQSRLEAALNEDPSWHYARLTFATRDLYRHVVERIAKRAGLPEADVAGQAVALARRAAAQPEPRDSRQGHVGYYLVDEGLAQLEAATGYRPMVGQRLHRAILGSPNLLFFGAITAGTAGGLAALISMITPAPPAVWLTVLLFALIPVNDLATAITNQLLTALLPPRTLPRLELRAGTGIPEDLRTAVVVPTLFGSVAAVREALDHLEVQFLANREANLHFAILSDFTDSTAETTDEDAEILKAAVDGVRALDARHAESAGDVFFLFHRPRRWNPGQSAWMGWERKRGKLSEFNQFLRGGAREAFSTIVGDPAVLRQVRYVITLDADTVLPPDAALTMVGTMAHPLNLAVYDPARGRIVRGHGIIQPRVEVSLPSAHRSHFAAIHSGSPGVDPYTTAVSDVYQDLYGEGSFTGKGIYDVDAFEQATRGRFPENTLLSHDLIEGNYARAGLATDILVYDDYPIRYTAHARRKHRWIRGDWQLLRWLTSWVPGPTGRERNRLSLLSRWKILDNLRRSTVEIAQLALLVAGWTILPAPSARWTVLGLLIVAGPWIFSLLIAAVQPPFDKSWRAYYASVARDAETSLQQALLAITFLPHQACISADAIVRTLWRLAFSRRHLLDWQTARQSEGVAGSARDTWRTMWPVVGLALGILTLVSLDAVAGGTTAETGLGIPFGVVGALVGLWALSPAIAQSLNTPSVLHERRLPRALRQQAMRYALLHWCFFERFVGPETSWLAPDNYQDDPAPEVAMRTSPTNVGLQLLSTISAYDLGFITLEQMTRRLELAFASMERMRRHQGHLYNWYDLKDLNVLEPAYISTVDSGNLAGHLIALRQACLSMPDERVFDARVWGALGAALTLAVEALHIEPAAARGAAKKDAQGQMRAFATATARIGAARAALASAAGPGSEPVSFAAIVAPLQEALAALETVASGQRAVDLAREWIDWALKLMASRTEQLAGCTPRPGVGRRGEACLMYPTHRELSARSPQTASLLARIDSLADRAYVQAMSMDFRFLYDETRKLFAIGYLESSHTRDTSYYDLLASEARLASFIAIAKSDVPVEHWFRLGRTLTHAAGATTLVSWSGSMFEYLMPALVMQSFPFTVLDQTHKGAVRRQISYGAERGVPWGVSESAYNFRDRHLTYQYRAFGVPDLALKRGLGRDLVIAPYASALSVMIDPARALANLGELEKLGALGPYGFRDAVDYTRPSPGQRCAVVQNYMAHHVGMAFVALTNALTAKLWQRRFHRDKMVRATELLLHERVPRLLVLQEAQATLADDALPAESNDRPAERVIDTPFTPQPRVALLGHVPYTIMVTQSGSGYSRYEELAVTRWRADGTRDNTGQFCYIKDLGPGRLWSAAHQPVCAPADWYRAVLATDRVSFNRADGDIETCTVVVAVPADAAEVRRVTVTNNGREPREIELTSYGEIVLARPDADRAHPAFANLFVETEWHDWCSALTATRRPRSASEKPLWCVHVVATGKERVGPVSYESDRARFIGRGRSTRDPAALHSDGPLAGTTGAVLDPIFALRTRVRVESGQSATVAFTTLVATSRERAFELADRYDDPHAAQRAMDLAWTATEVELRELDTTAADAAVYQELAGHLFFSNEALRAPQDELCANRGSQSLLWASGLSGDWPILLATIDSPEGLTTLRQLFAAHRYWRRRGMTVDLVVVNGQASTYLQEVSERITESMFASGEGSTMDRPGGVFIRRKDQLGAADLAMLRATARVHIRCDGRSLARAVSGAKETVRLPAIVPEELTPVPVRLLERSLAAERNGSRVLHRTPRGGVASVTAAGRGQPGAELTSAGNSSLARAAVEAPAATLAMDNGFGGLAPDGAYQIRVQGRRVPPAPWANVVANPSGGFVVTESGGGFTWVENSYFFRLTPWHNDPVSDPVSEVVYLRDDDSGTLWSATPAPIGHDIPYTVRHGAGSSSFAHQFSGIATLLTMGLAASDGVKLTLLRVTNHEQRHRRITVTAYVEWTLGVLREHTQHQVRTHFEEGAIFAQNFFDPQFTDRVAFATMSEVDSHTADRREFLGRNGHTGAPQALRGERLSGRTGVGIDPCAALQRTLELAPGQTREIVIALGAAVGDASARQMAADYRQVARAKAEVQRTIDQWDARLSVIAVRTPDPAFDAMLNRWTLYQALACRMWARSGLYQSSGAYGFRDQLQDVMAFVYAEPGIAREHILRAAARQFEEGDVQHWWHPQSGRGVRTRFSDDLVWLPYVVDHYLGATGDTTLLDQQVPYLTMRALHPDEHEIYDLPAVSAQHASVYQHCLLALQRACTTGAHGLPLIGIGDWNDGMSRVGVEGKGESVWLAWFLIRTLRVFAARADARPHDPDAAAVAADLRAKADAYAAAVEAHGWDGQWYRRAYFDDGTPLGSATSDECRIDAIAQSWSVISGAGDPERRAQAMAALEQHLVREDARLLMLLTPPFDKTPHDPGYIKGYLPGVRENGAQYTHAALWAVLATARRGDGDRAFSLFQMLNPLTHAATPEDVATYKVEPYVVAADVYTAAGHLGRGGWTWYTGSASWMYRVGLEEILGFTKQGDRLSIKPCVPRQWRTYTIEYRFGSSMYAITVRPPQGATPGQAQIVTVDGTRLPSCEITLIDDGRRHEVTVG